MKKSFDNILTNYKIAKLNRAGINDYSFIFLVDIELAEKIVNVICEYIDKKEEQIYYLDYDVKKEFNNKSRPKSPPKPKVRIINETGKEKI